MKTRGDISTSIRSTSQVWYSARAYVHVLMFMLPVFSLDHACVYVYAGTYAVDVLVKTSLNPI